MHDNCLCLPDIIFNRLEQPGQEKAFWVEEIRFAKACDWECKGHNISKAKDSDLLWMWEVRVEVKSKWEIGRKVCSQIDYVTIWHSDYVSSCLVAQTLFFGWWHKPPLVSEYNFDMDSKKDVKIFLYFSLEVLWPWFQFRSLQILGFQLHPPYSWRTTKYVGEGRATTSSQFSAQAVVSPCGLVIQAERLKHQMNDIY